MKKKRLFTLMLAVVMIFNCAYSAAPTSNAKAKSFDGLVVHMKKKKIFSGKKTRKEASMIGAKKGVAYNGIEVYEFNKNSKAYKKMRSTKKVTLKGLNMKVKVSAINGKFALIIGNTNISKKKICKAFKNY